MNYKEIGNIDDLKDGEMKQVSAGETNVLLARVRGKYYATGANCTHYGAPLADGVLCDERIVCPWHHACFNATTGDLEEPPAMDALPQYDLKIEDRRILVNIPDEPSDRRTPQMAKPDSEADKRVFVILGGGAAGYAAAQVLREERFQGRILMITREDRLPYDRPNLSKDYLQGHAQPEWMPLRPDEFFDEHGIEIARNKEVTRVDPASKTIAFADGGGQSYDAALIATGGIPRKLTVSGNDLANVFLLRSFADADAIIAAAGNASRGVVIGASFIGMEAAASLTARELSVTVVSPDSVPFERTLGPQLGNLFKSIHEKNGVSFKLKSSVARIEGKGKVSAVVLDNNERIEADLVIVGIGVQPATSFLEGVTLHQDGSVVVDSRLRAADGLFAAGDIARFPDRRTGHATRIEHWRTAQQQGRIAGRNMLGKSVSYDDVPFFWTQQFDATLSYVGHAHEWDEIIVNGDLDARDFLAFYVKGKKILAVAGVNRDRDLDAIQELIRLDKMPDADKVRGGSINFVTLLTKSL